MHILAEVTFKQPENYQLRFLNGLRCIISYEGMPAAECAIGFESGVEEVLPGVTVYVFICLMTPELHAGKLEVGDTFELVSVPYKIATGTVVDL